MCAVLISASLLYDSYHRHAQTWLARPLVRSATGVVWTAAVEYPSLQWDAASINNATSQSHAIKVQQKLFRPAPMPEVQIRHAL